MNIPGQSSFEESNYSYGFMTHKSEYSSSSSETSSSRRPNSTADHSDIEVILASARPKKRAGRRIFKETRHPVYRGVRRRNNNRWVCEVRVPNHKSRRIWLGTYPTPEMAARAHDVAALTLRGKSACLNFADSAWRLPLPASTNAEEIRRVAAEAAEAFAAEDNYQQQQSVKVVTHYEVCSSNRSVGVEAMEDANKAVQEEGMFVDEVPAFEDLHDWLVSMADEPLRSPPPFVRFGSGDWNDFDFDAEVSLWSFSI